MSEPTLLKKTRLHQLHLEAGAEMAPFAGYDMPVRYPPGIIREHLHTRQQASLFDVSHMGQIRVSGADAATRLESLIPTDLVSLAVGKQKYGLLLNEDGGVIDDLMVARIAQTEFILVVNASCKTNDFSHLRYKLGKSLNVESIDDRSLLALQGPKSSDVMNQLGHDLSDMEFMAVSEIILDGVSCLFSRSGYTGEDGFEVSVPHDHAIAVAELFLSSPDVAWAGLGARDSLRMEAGLPLYGHEITQQTTPVEAGLSWAIPKARRLHGERAGGFPGDHVILPQIPRQVSRLLVGLQPVGRMPVRQGAVIEDNNGNTVGTVTSGGFSPSMGKPVCMAYVELKHTELSDSDTEQDAGQPELYAVVRDKRLPVRVTRLPFVKRNYYRKR